MNLVDIKCFAFDPEHYKQYITIRVNLKYIMYISDACYGMILGKNVVFSNGDHFFIDMDEYNRIFSS